MKILLAVKESSDLRGICSYLSRRFISRELSIDLLHVLPVEAPDDRLTRAEELVSQWMRKIRENLQEAKVRMHIDHGDPAELIRSCGERWRSQLILLGAARRRGLLTAFRSEGVTRRLLARSRVPVELARPFTVGEKAGFKALAVVTAEDIGVFPFQALAQLPWHEGGWLRILCAGESQVDTSQVEAGAAAILKACQMQGLQHLCAEVKLGGVVEELSASLGGSVCVEYEIRAASKRGMQAGLRQVPEADLVVLCSAATQSAMNGHYSVISPLSIALGAEASVLLLRPRESLELARVSVLPGNIAQLPFR